MIWASVRSSAALARDYARGRFLWSMPLLLVLLFGLSAPSAAEASTYRWQVDANGNWNDPANWELVDGPAGAGYPNLAGDAAVFDEPLTALRTVTIPDTVTITIGRLTVAGEPDNNRVSIERTGTGLLVFDNLGEDAVIESSGELNFIVVATPIQLAADMTVNGNFQFFRIDEAGGARSVTITAGNVELMQPNTYSGTTTLIDGVLTTSSTATGARIPGALVAGDGVGAATSAQVLLNGDSIAHSADVQVNADAQMLFQPNAVPQSWEHTIHGLTVAGGRVGITGSPGALTVQDVTMQGGEVVLEGGVFDLTGSLTATSTAAGPATVRASSNSQPGALRLGPGNHDFTIADGPQAVDFLVDIARITEKFPLTGLNKLGAGVMRSNGGNAYDGPTAVSAGTLLVDGIQTGSAVQVDTLGTLGGSGSVGAITAAANGTVAPGRPVGILHSQGAAFTAGAHFAVEIANAASFDVLDVIGPVSLGNATLDLTSSFPLPLPPAATFKIIENDGVDPVVGTFAGLAEGASVITPSGAVFQITYQGGTGNDVVLANMAPVTYFLSEGATGTFFDEDVLIANPNTVPAPVTMTFFLPGGGTVVHQLTVPAQARVTVKVDEIPQLEATSASVEVRSDNRLTLAVERTMFWDSTHYGGHTANAVSAIENTWFFSEGSQGYFDTFLLLANANPAVANVKVTFLLENGAPLVVDLELPAQSRTNVYAGDYPELVGQSFGIKVEGPVTAERAMYFGTTPQRLWSGGHDNVGSPVTSTSWFHPEGASGSFFYTFILMANPNATKANVTMKYLMADGTDPIVVTREIQPERRMTLNPATEGITRLQNAAFSIVVTSDVPIVSERAMYWQTDDVLFGEGHASSGLTSAAMDWSLAEGRVGGPNAYTTYILLANPNAIATTVKVTFLRESGAALVKSYDVPANSRFNIEVGTMVPELRNESFGAFIETQTANAPIAVERSMYWNSEGRFWSGGTNAVGSVVVR